MDNRFKFRNWRKYPKGEMVYWDLNDVISNRAPIEILQDFPLVRENVMQCTGLKDKNGKLIYEGDILIRCNANPARIIVSIEKTNIGFSVIHRELTKNRLYSFCDKCEIIGNIYENPELLESADYAAGECL